MDLKYSLSKESYSWKNTLTWGVCAEHFAKAKTGNLEDRIIHTLIGISHIFLFTAILEKLIVTSYVETDLSTKKIVVKSDAATTKKTQKFQPVKSPKFALAEAKEELQERMKQGQEIFEKVNPKIQELKYTCESLLKNETDADIRKQLVNLENGIREYANNATSLRIDIEVYGQTHLENVSKEFLKSAANEIAKQSSSLLSAEEKLEPFENKLTQLLAAKKVETEALAQAKQNVKIAMDQATSLFESLESQIQKLKNKSPSSLSLWNYELEVMRLKLFLKTHRDWQALDHTHSLNNLLQELAKIVKPLQTKEEELARIEDELVRKEQAQVQLEQKRALDQAQYAVQTIMEKGTSLLKKLEAQIQILSEASPHHAELFNFKTNANNLRAVLAVHKNHQQLHSINHLKETSQKIGSQSTLAENDLPKLQRVLDEVQREKAKKERAEAEQKAKIEQEQRLQAARQRLQGALQESKNALIPLETKMHSLETKQNDLLQKERALATPDVALLRRLNESGKAIDQVKQQVVALKNLMKAAQNKNTQDDINQSFLALNTKTNDLRSISFAPLEIELNGIEREQAKNKAELERQVQAQKEAAALKTAQQNLQNGINQSRSALNPFERKVEALEVIHDRLNRAEQAHRDVNVTQELARCKTALNNAKQQCNALKLALQSALNNQSTTQDIQQALQNLKGKTIPLDLAALTPFENKLREIEQLQERRNLEIQRQVQAKVDAQTHLRKAFQDGTSLANRLREDLTKLETAASTISNLGIPNENMRNRLANCNGNILKLRLQIEALNQELARGSQALNNPVLSTENLNERQRILANTLSTTRALARNNDGIERELGQIQQRIQEHQNAQRQAEQRRLAEEARLQREQQERVRAHQAEQQRQAAERQAQEAAEREADAMAKLRAELSATREQQQQAALQQLPEQVRTKLAEIQNQQAGKGLKRLEGPIAADDERLEEMHEDILVSNFFAFQLGDIAGNSTILLNHLDLTLSKHVNDAEALKSIFKAMNLSTVGHFIFYGIKDEDSFKNFLNLNRQKLNQDVLKECNFVKMK